MRLLVRTGEDQICRGALQVQVLLAVDCAFGMLKEGCSVLRISLTVSRPKMDHRYVHDI
jgi:hypothetical protein